MLRLREAVARAEGGGAPRAERARARARPRRAPRRRARAGGGDGGPSALAPGADDLDAAGSPCGDSFEVVGAGGALVAALHAWLTCGVAALADARAARRRAVARLEARSCSRSFAAAARRDEKLAELAAAVARARARLGGARARGRALGFELGASTAAPAGARRGRAAVMPRDVRAELVGRTAERTAGARVAREPPEEDPASERARRLGVSNRSTHASARGALALGRGLGGRARAPSLPARPARPRAAPRAAAHAAPAGGPPPPQARRPRGASCSPAAGQLLERPSLNTP